MYRIYSHTKTIIAGIKYVIFRNQLMRHYVCGPPISDRPRIGTAGVPPAPARRETTTGERDRR